MSSKFGDAQPDSRILPSSWELCTSKRWWACGRSATVWLTLFNKSSLHRKLTAECFDLYKSYEYIDKIHIAIMFLESTSTLQALSILIPVLLKVKEIANNAPWLFQEATLRISIILFIEYCVIHGQIHKL